MSANFGMGPGGEFDMVRDMVDIWGDLAVGIGSDCALLQVPPGSKLAVSTDTSVEGIHFRRDWLGARDIGYRATAAALSDLAAAAASPLGILVALSLSDVTRGEFAEIAHGIGEAARDSGARIVGGDISAAAEMSITVTVLGSSPRPLARAGAKVGDRILLTGELGLVAAALRKLEAGARPTSAEMRRFARPVPRVEEALWLAAHGATAAIDVSDGLGSELRHLAAASGARLRVTLERIPVYSGVTALEAINSGEEYELMVAAPAELSLDDFRLQFATPIAEIGAVVQGDPGAELIAGGRQIELPGGYRHF